MYFKMKRGEILSKTTNELVQELIGIKEDRAIKEFGLEDFQKNYANYYEKFKSDAEFEVSIGVYPPKK